MTTMTRPLVQINDVVREMNDKEYAEWLAGESQRKEQAATLHRQERNRRLAASDWTQLPDTPSDNAAAWKEYRQALRDITLQSGFPLKIDWPVEPV